jgi:LPXTG-motif cell wall-anchored protein
MYAKSGVLASGGAGGAGLAGGQLPYTGTDAGELALIALGLIVAGFTILFAARAILNLLPKRR